MKRLNKYLSEIGYCSRREADRLIEEKRVLVNGLVANIGDKISENDVISIDGKVLQKNSEYVFIAFNKPKGIICTTDQSIKNNIIDYIKHKERIFHIGRLDKDSEGLIFLTNDGDIVNKILRAKNKHEKEYIVHVDKRITPDFIKEMATGVPILDTVTEQCIVEKLDRNSFKIVLTQGLNRQIRRMCEYFGYNVTNLKRVRIMNILLDVNLGEWRDLTVEELRDLNGLLRDSLKTEDASL